MPVIGFLRSASLANATPLVTAFRQGLSETNFVEGQNVAIEFRSAEGHNDRLPGLTAELIQLPVSVLVCNVTAALAAKAVTTRVPIVFATGTDPIEDGLITSLSHPGGNITGVSFRSDALGAKQLELLHELLPAAKTVVVLLDTNFSGAVAEIRDIQAGARRSELLPWNEIGNVLDDRGPFRQQRPIIKHKRGYVPERVHASIIAAARDRLRMLIDPDRFEWQLRFVKNDVGKQRR